LRLESALEELLHRECAFLYCSPGRRHSASLRSARIVSRAPPGVRERAAGTPPAPKESPRSIQREIARLLDRTSAVASASLLLRPVDAKRPQRPARGARWAHLGNAAEC
jgi:hypothetical protein